MAQDKEPPDGAGTRSRAERVEAASDLLRAALAELDALGEPMPAAYVCLAIELLEGPPQ